MNRLSKQNAIKYCHKKGVKFIALFIEVVKTYRKEKQYEIINKMQQIIDDINDIILTKTKKKLYYKYRLDWFYTINSSYDELFDNEDIISLYDKFIFMLETTKNVKISLEALDIQIHLDALSGYDNILIVDILTSGKNAKNDKIIKFGYISSDYKMNKNLQGYFYIKYDNKKLDDAVLKKYKIDKKDIEGGQTKDFLLDLIKMLIKNKTLLVSYNVNLVVNFLSEFLIVNNMEELLKNVDILNLLTVFKENCLLNKSYNLTSACNFYEIENIKAQNNAEIYYLLLTKMLEINDINSYIQNIKVNK